MLRIQVPDNFHPERNYIISVIFGEFLGLDYQVEVSETQKVLISNDDHQVIHLADHFFSISAKQWLQPVSLPTQPLAIWNLDDADIYPITVSSLIPVIYGEEPNNPNFFTKSEDTINLELDILGSSFFMLTRYEEVVKPDRDHLDRFPAKASLAYQESFLDRPIINEYLEILWSCLQALWPSLQRKQHCFATLVSHDLDEPFLYAGTGLKRLLQRCAGDIVRRGSVVEMGRTLAGWWQVTNGKPELDPYNTFDLIMDISEENNLKSAFYFIADRTAGALDGFYSLDQPLIRNLLKDIHVRGHEIGLHTSFNTYCNQEQTKKEFDRLKQVCEEEGIEQELWGGRQHYLRWQSPTTFQNWEFAGLNYDSTLTYPEKIGFRCGTCYQYTVFNLLTKKHLKLKEVPLCIMEVSVTRKSYMGLDINDSSAFLAIEIIKNRCKLFNGIFSILWHNTSFIQENEIGLYQRVIAT